MYMQEMELIPYYRRECNLYRALNLDCYGVSSLVLLGGAELLEGSN